ncbi:uncharacterized protein [Montipora foliosa]|uniref:uncharacterized protein isoform X1 n=1 Tax=Montipora foliosa TaxID=591990 RepID=UPI0035F10485
METRSIGAIWLGVLCFSLMPFANGAEEYLIDKETDDIILDLVIIFFVLCVVFLLSAIVLVVVLRRKEKSGISFKRSFESEAVASPFYGLGVYSPSSESQMYLPGRPSMYEMATILSDNSENDGAGESSEDRQTYAALTERTRVTETYQNPAYEESGYHSLEKIHEYEKLDSTFKRGPSDPKEKKK